MLFYMREKARSSGGERFLDTEEVGGSKPPGPTISAFQTFFISSQLVAEESAIVQKSKRTEARKEIML